MLSQPIPSSPAQCCQDTTYAWGPDDECYSAKGRGGLASTIHRFSPRNSGISNPRIRGPKSRTWDFSSLTFSRPFRAHRSPRENGWMQHLALRPVCLGRRHICPSLSNLYKAIWDTFLDTHLSLACAPTWILPPFLGRQYRCIDTFIFTFNPCATFSSHRVAGRGLEHAHWTHQF